MNRLLQVGGEEKVPGRNEPAVEWAGSACCTGQGCAYGMINSWPTFRV